MKNFIKAIIWLVVIALLVYGGFYGYQKIQKTIYPIKYSEIIEKNADEYGLERSLVYAVVKCESKFNKNAVSNVGAKGLMQLTPETYKWVCSKYGDTYNDSDDLFDPQINVKMGCRLLRLNLKEFRNVKTVLAAYHAGRSRVKEWLNNSDYSDDQKTLKKIPYSDTSKYVEKVTKTIEKYKEIYNIK